MTNKNENCGVCGFYPQWLKSKATPKVFLIVYGLLGTVQAMASVYIIVTLTTIEKRFKIPTRTTGIILSGNEISQVLSLVLTYYGGSGHRPRWIAVGVAFSAASCFVLAMPHWIYGPGKDALALTKEHLDLTMLNATEGSEEAVFICPRVDKQDSCDADTQSDYSVFPRLLVFLSQFILGIGSTLYYGLGQPYLDDNTQKKNTPMLLGITFALRTIGPVFGFVLGFGCLGMYIDPSLHPLITKRDPRWLGAWWLGWVILGVAMSMFAILIAMFPKQMPKPQKETPKDGEIPLKLDLNPEKNSSMTQVAHSEVEPAEAPPTLKEFLAAMKRIFTNKLLTLNNFSGIFYILAASVYITLVVKYVEVQFGTTSATGALLAGPITLIGMVLGFIVSGVVISKFKPGPRPLLFWNVIVGFCGLLGQIAFIFLGCSNNGFHGLDVATMQLNLTANCNANCGCDGIKYAPVCHEDTGTTFYSACHAGCRTILNPKEFGDCACVNGYQTAGYHDQLNHREDLVIPLSQHIGTSFQGSSQNLEASSPLTNFTVKSGPCVKDCMAAFIIFNALSCLMHMLSCSGRIGNVLVNYRCVETRDKSLSQGITLMMIALFAFIPGPIIFGAIMDSTCLIWEEACGERGNCWFYDKESFRTRINVLAVIFTVIGVGFDVAVWYLGKGVDLYGATDEDKRRDFAKDVYPVALPEVKKSEVHTVTSPVPETNQNQSSG